MLSELEQLGPDVLALNDNELLNRSRMLENNIKVMKSELLHLQHEQASMAEKIKENKEKIKLNKQLPYLVSNVVEVAVR